MRKWDPARWKPAKATEAIGSRGRSIPPRYHIDPLLHQVLSVVKCIKSWGEHKQMSPQAGEIADSDGSLLRLEVSCATTADERQSKMKCILPDVNTANCQSPQGNQSSRRKETGERKKSDFINRNTGYGRNRKMGRQHRTAEHCHRTEGLQRSLLSEIRKDWAQVTGKMKQWRQDPSLHPWDPTTYEDPQVPDHLRPSFFTRWPLRGHGLWRNPEKLRILCAKKSTGAFSCTGTHVLF